MCSPAARIAVVDGERRGTSGRTCRTGNLESPLAFQRSTRLGTGTSRAGGRRSRRTSRRRLAALQHFHERRAALGGLPPRGGERARRRRVARELVVRLHRALPPQHQPSVLLGHLAGQHLLAQQANAAFVCTTRARGSRIETSRRRHALAPPATRVRVCACATDRSRSAMRPRTPPTRGPRPCRLSQRT